MNNLIITRVLLVGYNRINLSGITRFEFTPDEMYTLQLILGTNGSGKSSLQWVMWFLPADKEHFAVNGRHEIDGYYNGKFYQVASIFEGKPFYSFKVDGVELNEGGKIEMCRALCEEHLKVTNEIRLMALGKDPLTIMSPGRRRYWLVKLADTDFTYAMKVYNNLKSAHRDAQGAINRLQKRLVAERMKLVDGEVVSNLTKETHEIKALITEIYNMRNAEATKSPEVLQKLVDNFSDLDRFMDEIDGFNTHMLETSGYNNREELQARRESLKLQIHSAQQIQQHLFTDHTKIKKKYDQLVKAGTESLAELEAKVEYAREQIAYKETFIALRNVAIEYDPQQMADTLKEIYHDLYDKISSLPSNEGQYSRETAEQSEQVVSDYRKAINVLQARISRLSSDIEHKRDHVQKDSVTCPECKHSWTTKASESDIQKAEVQLAELKDIYDKHEAKLELVLKYLKEYSEYADAYRAVVQMMRSAPVLRNYFNEITQNGRLIRYPGSVAAELFVVQSDLEHQVEIARQKKIIEAATEQIALKKNLDADTLESIEADLAQIEEASSIQAKKLTALGEELQNVEYLLQRHGRITTLHDSILSGMHLQNEYIQGYIYSRFQETLWELILSLQTQLARKEDALAQITAQQQIVFEIESQLKEAIMNEAVAKMAHIALSPTSGAIAEGLHRFVNLFVTRLNKVINSIWSYPLEILPFKLEDEQADLDYKFPFIVNKELPAKKDVFEGSESMLEIFNHAWKVCCLKQLGLSHLPLFLDEFEKTFDDAHREKVIYYIKRLVDEQAFGQIFMISHYESNHGALNGLAQTCVLSRDNLLLPSNVTFNEHVNIN